MPIAHQPIAPAKRSPAPGRRPTVLVTGGSGGIGRAICMEFGRAGWQVAVHYREHRTRAERTVAGLAGFGGEGFPVRADVRDAGQVAAMVRSVVARWSHLDVFVCNAGLASSRLLLRMGSGEWDATIDTNLTGTFHCLRAVAEHMLARRRGSVVVVGSFAGVQGHPGQAAYAASKGGLLGLVKTAAREWGRSNVTINVVFPGWQRTSLSGGAMPEAADLHDHALGRTPDLGEVARSVYHLALLKDVSGQVWNFDSRILS